MCQGVSQGAAPLHIPAGERSRGGSGGDHASSVPDIYRYPALEFPKHLPTHCLVQLNNNPEKQDCFLCLADEMGSREDSLVGHRQSQAWNPSASNLLPSLWQHHAPSQAMSRMTRRKVPRSKGDSSHPSIPTTQTPTRSPGKAMSGFETAAIFAKAWAAFTLPTSVPSKAKGIRACKKGHSHFCHSNPEASLPIFPLQLFSVCSIRRSSGRLCNIINS